MDVFSPYIQFGFAGLSFALVAVIVWFMKNMIALLSDVSRVIEHNSNVIGRLETCTDRLERASKSLRDELLSRPCLAKEDAE